MIVAVHSPKSPDFFSDLLPDVIKKFKRLGWNIEKTVFLKVPYVLTFLNTLEPAAAGNFIVPIYDRGTYFRVLVLSHEAENEPGLDLEDTILHEMKELREQEVYLTTHGLHPERTEARYLEEEESILESTSQEISKKHSFTDAGHVEKAWGGAALRMFRIRDRVGVIGNQAVFVWLCEYLEKNYERYSVNAIPLTSAMVAAKDELIKEEIEDPKSSILSLPDKQFIQTFTFIGDIK